MWSVEVSNISEHCGCDVCDIRVTWDDGKRERTHWRYHAGYLDRSIVIEEMQAAITEALARGDE